MVVLVLYALMLFAFPLPSLGQSSTAIPEKCRRFFDCGEFKIDYFPFWGGPRPSDCGVPGFELHCENDEHAVITISGIKHRVLKITRENYTMVVARSDLLDNICPSWKLDDSPTTVDGSYYAYTTSVANLTLAYNCPGSEFAEQNTFTCPGSNDHNNRYFSDTSLNLVLPELLGRCDGGTLRVPVNRSELLLIERNGVAEVLEKGYEVNYTATATVLCSACRAKGGVCNDNTPFLCTVHKPSIIKKIIIGIVFGGIVILLVLILLCCYKNIKSQNIPLNLANKDQDIEDFIRSNGHQTAKRYKFSDVKKMTKSFKDNLGQGGFGEVYKGELFDGRLVAVKLLNSSKGNGEEFMNEVASISRTSHVNIVMLLGFCLEGRKRALIYEFMPNGSLDKFVFNENSSQTNPNLEWNKHIQIATGIARGLEYLHRGCNTRILHFDIKPHNILLDEDLCPKISDFGLAKLCPDKQSNISLLDARGTIGYIAPEVFNRNFGVVSSKSDVYSFGMMVLEMVGGRKNIKVGVSRTSEIYFPDWIYKHLEIGDKLKIWGDMTSEENGIAKKMIIVGLWCIQIAPSDRPTMSKVIEMLEGSLEALQTPPKPTFLSPERCSAEQETESSIASIL